MFYFSCKYDFDASLPWSTQTVTNKLYVTNKKKLQIVQF